MNTVNNDRFYDTPNEDPGYTPEQIREKKDAIYTDRVSDLSGWFLESITEADNLQELQDAVIYGDATRIGDIINDMITAYCTPTDEECIEELEKS